MTLLISYKNYYGAHVFFLPGAHSMLKPALHTGFRDFDLLFMECFDPAFLDNDLLFLAVLHLIVIRPLLIVRPHIFFFIQLEETAIFFIEALLQMFFFIVTCDFNLGISSLLLHLLLMFVIAILLSVIVLYYSNIM